ncbi:hypothetical protein LOK49_Contig88G00002 [Camellia lanceoleosa]|nr:hypothetical protein LOK49_Contig88G00002 [Camellia lanceoleosa]
MSEYNEQLSRILEPLQTNDALEKIFHDMMGTNGHRYYKTWDRRNLKCSEIEESLTAEIEQRITNKLKIEFEQIPNASSGN